METFIEARDVAREWESSATLACSLCERIRGKLTDEASRQGVTVIAPCRAIHTVGMRYPIDVAFVGKGGCVLKSQRNVAPHRYLSCHRARYVLERVASPDAPWLAEGEEIRLRIGIVGREG